MTENNRSSAGNTEKKSIEGFFTFPPSDGIYKDHFPGYPVVPGSLIVQAFLKAGEKAGFSGENITIQDFRFREFLRPGRHPFRIDLQGTRLHCTISREGKNLVTGVLKK